jgi:hypothetical protein
MSVSRDDVSLGIFTEEFCLGYHALLLRCRIERVDRSQFNIVGDTRISMIDKSVVQIQLAW